MTSCQNCAERKTKSESGLCIRVKSTSSSGSSLSRAKASMFLQWFCSTGFSNDSLLNWNLSFLITSLAALICSSVAERRSSHTPKMKEWKKKNHNQILLNAISKLLHLLLCLPLFIYFVLCGFICLMLMVFCCMVTC